MFFNFEFLSNGSFSFFLILSLNLLPILINCDSHPDWSGNYHYSNNLNDNNDDLQTVYSSNNIPYPGPGPSSGDLRLGISAKLTRRNGCGAVRIVAAARAVHDINTRNSTFCPAISNLGDKSLFNVSIDVLDHVGNSELAIYSGLYFANVVDKKGIGSSESESEQTDSDSESTQQLQQRKKVHGIVGFTTSGTSISGAPAMSAIDLPMVCYSSTSPLLSERVGSNQNLKYPNFFRVCPGDQNRVKAAARAMKELGYQSAISLYFSAPYTQTMCDYFRQAAEQLGIEITSHELLSSEVSGSALGDREKSRISEILQKIHGNPRSARVIMACAFDAELEEVLQQAKEKGMRNRDSGYFWLSAEEGGLDPAKALGTFSLSWIPDSDRTPLFKSDYERGLMRTYYGNERFFNENICGSTQNKKCWDMPNSTTNGGDYFLYASNPNSKGQTAQTNFDLCKTYTQFGYDSIVMYAAAVHKGITSLKLFDKNSITSSLLEESLKSLIGDSSYGECLSSGILMFNQDQERNLPYELKNYYAIGERNTNILDGPNSSSTVQNSTATDSEVPHDNVTKSYEVSAVRIARIPETMSKNVIFEPNAYLASCSIDQPLGQCFKSSGPTSQLRSDNGGYFPSGRAPTCISGQYWDQSKGNCRYADPGYYSVFQVGNQTQTQSVSDNTTNNTNNQIQTFNPNLNIESVPFYQTPCQIGTYSSTIGSTNCFTSAAGYYVNSSIRTAQIPCPIGTFSDEKGSQFCQKCSQGDYQPNIGQQFCIRCEKGSYQDEKGQSICKECPQDRTTMGTGAQTINQCVCHLGWYLNHENNRCQKCPQGIRCLMGASTKYQLGSNETYDQMTSQSQAVTLGISNISDSDSQSESDTSSSSSSSLVQNFWTPMSVKPGFWVDPELSKISIPLQVTKGVYSCDAIGEKVLQIQGYYTPCPGGQAGQCEEGRDGNAIACGRCLEGFYPDKQRGGGCYKCDDIDKYWIFIVIGITIIMLPQMYYFLNSEMQANLDYKTVALICFGHLITLLQLSVVISSISISWPGVLHSLWNSISIFGLNFESIRSQCAFGPAGMSGFFIASFLPLILATVLFGIAWMNRSWYTYQNGGPFQEPQQVIDSEDYGNNNNMNGMGASDDDDNMDDQQDQVEAQDSTEQITIQGNNSSQKFKNTNSSQQFQQKNSFGTKDLDDAKSNFDHINYVTNTLSNKSKRSNAKILQQQLAMSGQNTTVKTKSTMKSWHTKSIKSSGPGPQQSNWNFSSNRTSLEIPSTILHLISQEQERKAQAAQAKLIEAQQRQLQAQEEEQIRRLEEEAQKRRNDIIILNRRAIKLMKKWKSRTRSEGHVLKNEKNENNDDMIKYKSDNQITFSGPFGEVTDNSPEISAPSRSDDIPNTIIPNQIVPIQPPQPISTPSILTSHHYDTNRLDQLQDFDNFNLNHNDKNVVNDIVAITKPSNTVSKIATVGGLTGPQLSKDQSDSYNSNNSRINSNNNRKNCEKQERGVKIH